MKNLKRLFCLALCIALFTLTACNNGVDPVVGINSAPAISSSDTAGTDSSAEASSNSSTVSNGTDPSHDATSSSDTSSSSQSSSSSRPSNSGSTAQNSSDSVSSSSTPAVPSVPTDKNYTPLSDSERYTVKYGGLTTTQKKIYQDVKTAVSKQQRTVSFSYAVSKNDLVLITQCVGNDYPEYGWFTGSYSITFQGDNVVSVTYDYLPAVVSYSADLALVQRAVENFYNSLPAGLSDYELELAAHDYICKNTDYDHSTANGATNNPYAYSAYGALVNGLCVCEGYSRAMQLLMNRVGIETGLVRGEAGGGGHMWNIIKIENGWYHLDVTWDDNDGNTAENEPSGFHWFFNLTTSQMEAAGHTIDPPFSAVSGSLGGTQTPSFNFATKACNVTAYNYFIKNGTYLNGNNENDLIKTALQNAKAKNQKYIELFADSSSYYRNVVSSSAKQNQIISLINQVFPKTASVSFKYSQDATGRIIFYWV